MKSIKHAALGLLLATAAFAASATEFNGYSLILGTPDTGTRQTFAFSVGDSTVKAGDTFSWDFYFDPAPFDPSTYFAFQAGGASAGTVSFDDALFGPINDPSTVPDGYFFAASDSLVQGNGYIGIGTYDLYVSGTFLANGAVVAGIGASDINPTYVPEPMSLSLVGLGLAGIAGLRRRKAR